MFEESSGLFIFGIVTFLSPCSITLISVYLTYAVDVRVLRAVLLTMFGAPTPYHGDLLLFAFGLGHALPVIFPSVLLATARKAVSKKTAIAGEWLTRIFGVAFVVIGMVMIRYMLGGW